VGLASSVSIVRSARLGRKPTQAGWSKRRTESM
jgi:hypothetical protein